MVAIDNRTALLPRVVIGVAAPAEAAPAAGRRPWWPWCLAAVSFGVYLAVAWHVVHGIGYEIGDAVARTAAAHHVVLSRDPHLAGVGFYWMPLPTLSQIPFVLLLAPFGQVRFAGPATSALWAALSIPVLAAIGRRNGAPPQLVQLLCTIYAISPVVVWAGSNGMSEASSFFFLTLIVYAYSVWRIEQRSSDLVLLAVALAGEMLCRYETIPLAIAMAGVVAVTQPRSRWGRTMVMIGLPAAYVFVLWLGASYLIVNDPFYWFKELNALAKASGPGAAIFATSGSHALNVLGFVTGFVLLFSVLLVALVPLCLGHTWRVTVADWRSTVRNLGLVVPGFVFPVLLGTQMLRRNAPAAARYFYPCWVVAVAAALALAGGAGWPRRTWRNRRAVIAAVAPLAAVVQLLALANPRVANVEHEDVLFAPLVGRPAPSVTGQGLLTDQLTAWDALFAVADPMLADGDRLLLDTDSAPQAVLFTRHPGQLVIPEDRDFEPILAAPRGRVQLIAVPRTLDGGHASRYWASILAVMVESPSEWSLVGSYGPLDLYRFTAATGDPACRQSDRVCRKASSWTRPSGDPIS